MDTTDPSLLPKAPRDPETNLILLPPVDFETLSNGQLRMLSKAAGVKFGQIRSMFSWNEDDVWEEDEDGVKVMVKAGKGAYDGPGDEADVLWAMGKLQLRKSGFDYSDSEADDVQFQTEDDEEDKAAASADVEADPSEAQ